MSSQPSFRCLWHVHLHLLNLSLSLSLSLNSKRFYQFFEVRNFVNNSKTPHRKKNERSVWGNRRTVYNLEIWCDRNFDTFFGFTWKKNLVWDMKRSRESSEERVQRRVMAIGRSRRTMNRRRFGSCETLAESTRKGGRRRSKRYWRLRWRLH